MIILCECVLEDGFSVCQSSQMEHRQYLLCSEDQILVLVGPPCPLPILQLLPRACVSVCVCIHLVLNDWHQRTGIPVRAHSSLTTSLLFMMRESAAVSPLSLFTQWFPKFRVCLFESCCVFFCLLFFVSEFEALSSIYSKLFLASLWLWVWFKFKMFKILTNIINRMWRNNNAVVMSKTAELKLAC